MTTSLNMHTFHNDGILILIKFPYEIMYVYMHMKFRVIYNLM